MSFVKILPGVQVYEYGEVPPLTSRVIAPALGVDVDVRCFTVGTTEICACKPVMQTSHRTTALKNLITFIE
jgi:hypothetical protein